MAIEGLIDRQSTPETTEVRQFRPGELRVSEEAAVVVEAMSMLGIVGDRDRVLETVTADFKQLETLGYDGRLFVTMPTDLISFDGLLEAAESERPDEVPALYRYPNLWTPGTEANSYSDQDLNQTVDQAVARLAVFNVEDTEVDPILLHLDIPFDDYAQDKWGGETTQLERVTEDKAVFETQHPDYNLADVDHRDFAFMILMDRIKGIKSPDMLLSQGFMRMQKLGRRALDGRSIVGNVSSGGSRLHLYWSYGFAYSDRGVGLSVGQKPAQN